jgi:hypothetical protein
MSEPMEETVAVTARDVDSKVRLQCFPGGQMYICCTVAVQSSWIMGHVWKVFFWLSARPKLRMG